VASHLSCRFPHQKSMSWLPLGIPVTALGQEQDVATGNELI
jgi:hypothetical protein